MNETEDNVSLENLLSSLGAPAADAETPEAPAPETSETSEVQTQTPDTTETSEQPQNNTKETKGTNLLNEANTKKLNDAFAKLRVQNSQYEKTLKGVASLLDLDLKNTSNEDLMKAIQTKITENQAQKQGVPPELLERLNVLEQEKQTRELNDIRTQAFLGFQKVKDKFGLSDEALQNFAASLQVDGINPFEQPVDIVSAYVMKNLDNIIATAKEQGIKEEQARAMKANTNSSSPNQKTGNVNPDNTSIKSVADLTKWFNSQDRGGS